jgi:hypothetical protein
MKNCAQPKHGENVHLNKKHRIKESHTVRISSVEQRKNQSLIHKANRRRKTRAKEGRMIDKTEKKREKERNTKERNTNLMVTLLLLVTSSLEAKLLFGEEEEASAKLFPDDKVVDLVPETCAATGTTQAVRVTLTADTHAISLLLFCPVYFLAHKPGDGNGKGEE